MPIDDNKHSERIPVYFTEREYLDICRSAARFDKKPGEYIRFEMRKGMYGSIGMVESQHKENDSANECRSRDGHS